MDSRELMELLSAPFPANAIEQREGARGRTFDYIATETVIRRLNRVCPAWDFRITEIREKDNLLVIWGELSIPGLGSRAGTGVQLLQGGEDMWKGAASDCLKKCATLFGVGIDLYGPDLEAGELAATAKPNLPARARTEGHNTVPNGTAKEDPWTVFWREAKAAGLNNWDQIGKSIGQGQDAFRNGDEALAALRAKTQGQPS